MYSNPRIETLNLYEAQSPIFYMSRALGLLPCSVKIPSSENLKNSQIFTLNTGWLLYSVFCFLIYLICLGLSFFSSENFATPENSPYITIVGQLLHIILGAFTAIVIVAYCSSHIQQIGIITKQLHALDDELNSINRLEVFKYKSIFKFQTNLLILGVLCTLFIAVFDAVLFYHYFENYFAFIWVSYLFPYLIAGNIQAQFIIAVYNILQRFKMINNFLNIIANENEPTSKAVKMYNLSTTNNANDTNIDENFEDPNIFIVSSQTRNETIENNEKPPSYSKLDEIRLDSQFESPKGDQKDQLFRRNKKFADKFKKNNVIAKNLHIKMNQLFTLHDRLCDISEIINDTFSVQLVACITSSFVVTLFGFFFETKVLFMLFGSNLMLILIASSYVLWGIILSLIIYFILSTCTTAREEASESALIIHKILQNKPAFMLNDEIFYSKMKSFTLQVLHRKNLFHFNGLGLFRLDYTFIFSVVSAATSYLIVLLQFDLSEDLARVVSTTANFTF